MFYWLATAGTGLPSGPRSPTCEATCGTLEFAHNPAAWVGIAACVLALWIWFDERKQRNESDEDDPSQL